MKNVEWIGSSYDDLNRFPKSVVKAMGYALYRAQIGEKLSHAKPLKGMGSVKVLEIREWNENGTFRVMYTVEFEGWIFVLHAFQKKSATGSETAKKDIDLLKARLKEAKERYKELKEES